MTILVREAVPEDAPQLQALYEVLTGRSSVLPSRVSEIAADARSFLFVAERSGTVVGTVFLSFCLDAMYSNQPFALIENVVVASSERSAGVGTALIRHAETQCLKHNCSKIMLLSASERTEAHRFFASLGYDQQRKVGFVKYRSRLATEAAQPCAPAGIPSTRCARLGAADLDR
jgi:N-acetylglutamate synthase-like GNAT family acetyltransferase